LSFNIQIRQADKVTLLDVSGRLTSFEGQAFRDAIQRLLRQGENNIVLNLKGLDYLDSSGVGELVRNYLAVVKKGGAMKVVGLAPKVEEILKPALSGLPGISRRTICPRKFSQIQPLRKFLIQEFRSRENVG
jgi:anti-anti-sigma factor